MKSLFAIAVIALAVAGCGSSDLVVIVTSDREVPGEVDNLRITISDVGQSDTLRSVTVRLGKPFPASVLFEVGDQTPERLRIEVEALQSDDSVTTEVVEAARNDDDVTEVTVELD